MERKERMREAEKDRQTENCLLKEKRYQKGRDEGVDRACPLKGPFTCIQTRYSLGTYC